MAFPKIRLGLDVARAIFEDVDFQEVTIGGKTAGYKATFKGYEYEDKAIVHLCRKIWKGQV
ncbi:MAG: hypothetical protein ACRC62_31660 [Microcoleus sp.]